MYRVVSVEESLQSHAQLWIHEHTLHEESTSSPRGKCMITKPDLDRPNHTITHTHCGVVATHTRYANLDIYIYIYIDIYIYMDIYIYTYGYIYIYA